MIGFPLYDVVSHLGSDKGDSPRRKGRMARESRVGLVNLSQRN